MRRCWRSPRCWAGTYEIKQLRWQPDYDVDPAEAGISLAGLDIAASDSLAAPWPDIVIGIGYRSAPVSRWIGQQAGRVINIRLGRPRTDLKPYDLVITTPQYGLPPAPNVRELPLPLVKADDGAMAKAIARWRSEFERCRRRASPCCSAARPSTWRSTMRSPAIWRATCRRSPRAPAARCSSPPARARPPD